MTKPRAAEPIDAAQQQPDFVHGEHTRDKVRLGR
jgi:hypothetical protein